MHFKKLSLNFYLVLLTIIITAVLTVKILVAKPVLSKNEMVSDFDQLITYINDFGVHKDINQIRLNIDYQKIYSDLRKQITKNTDICEFREILEKTINWVQDGHASSMDYEYLSNYGKYQSKYNFTNDEKFKDVKTIEKHCDSKAPSLTLPIHYIDGKYHFFTDFKYQGNEINVGDYITHYNAVPIDYFVSNNLDKISPVRWDAQKNETYHPSFYKFGDAVFDLKIQSNGEEKNIRFDLNTESSYKEESNRYKYYSQKEANVFALDDGDLLYISIPSMDLKLAEVIMTKVEKLYKKHKEFGKIVIDIRGNPGGNDQTWHEILSELISQPITLKLDLRFKHTEDSIEKYAETADKNSQWYRDKHDTTPIEIDILNNNKYWIVDSKELSLPPKNNSYKHQGKIFILQDRYIYSSATNLSRASLFSDQLISIGESTDLIGGIQTEPLFIKLNHSGIVFRIEPLLDFSGVSKFEDLFHNKVEVPRFYTSQELHQRQESKEDVFGQSYLEQHDPFIKLIKAHDGIVDDFAEISNVGRKEAISRWFESINESDLEGLEALYDSENYDIGDFIAYGQMVGGLTPKLISYQSGPEYGIYATENNSNNWVLVGLGFDGEKIIHTDVKKKSKPVLSRQTRLSDESAKIKIINHISDQILNNYANEKVRNSLANDIKNLANDRSLTLTRHNDLFAKKVTVKLREISNDKHLELVSPIQIQAINKRFHSESSVQDPNETFFIYEKKEGLPIISINRFSDIDAFKSQAVAVFSKLNESEASFVINLINGEGGDKTAVNYVIQLIESLDSFRNRKFAVLLGKKTFSASEYLAYYSKINWSNSVRIGQSTAGAGYQVDAFPVGAGFYFVNSVKNPLGDASWEGKGISPDIIVPEENATEKAINFLNQ